MPEFISKLQYKTYEKGEFSNEKSRPLAETIQLIKDFPWDEQRGVDVQLSSPSVTIMDEYRNYLKVAIYFNGKFCIYYFDVGHHLYEYHTDNLYDAYKQVTDFFNQQLDLGLFEKHLLSVGSKGHFETGLFEYRVNKSSMFLYFVVMLFFLVITAFFTLAFFQTKNALGLLALLPLFFDILYIAIFYFLVRMFFKAKDMSLYITRGSNDFQFLQDGQLQEFSKKDITAINIYGQTGRSSKLFNLMELSFKDGSNLIVPGALIDPLKFISKFPGTERDFKGGYFLTSGIFWNFSK
jgi:hypothetical protein